jgi:uncharacterized protein (UPF0305 family)
MKPLLPYLCLFLILIGTSCQEEYSDAMIQQQILLNATIQRTNLILKRNISFKIKKAKSYIENKIQYYSFYPKFKYVTEQSDSLYNEIEQLKRTLLDHSETYSSAAKVISTKTLTASVQSSYKNYLHFMESSWDNGGIKGTEFADSSKKESVMQKIKASLDLPFLSQIRADSAYLERQLKDKSVAAVLTFLSSIQNDIRKQEYHVFNFFSRQIGMLCNFGSSGFPLCVQYSKYYIRLGEIYDVKISLCGSANGTLLSTTVEGDRIPLLNERAIYTVKPSQTGKQAYRPTIMFLNFHTNLIDSLEQTFYFDVID